MNKCLIWTKTMKGKIKLIIVILLFISLYLISGCEPAQPPSPDQTFQSPASNCPTDDKVDCSDNCLNHHCPANKFGNQLVCHHILTLSNNCRTKFADWVAYEVKPGNLGGGKPDRIWQTDPDINDHCTLFPEDYKGAADAYGFDRGHQAPVSAFSKNPNYCEANYLSNITPQQANLNQGPWKSLENAVQSFSRQKGTIYVVTGPLYDGEKLPTLPNSSKKTITPTAYYKVIAVKEDGKLKEAGFIMPQTAKKNDRFCSYKVSIEEIEKRAGITIFPNIELPTASLQGQLGCG